MILATGALERPFPIPGWTLPGVMTAGAAQTMLKSSGLVPDGQTVIAGQGPLLWLLAAQILRLGGRIDRILDTTERRNYLARAASRLRLHDVALFRKGPRADAEVRAKVPVVTGVTRTRGRRRRPARNRQPMRPAADARRSRPSCCCCIRAWCPTSISRWPPGSSTAGTTCSSAGRPCSTRRQHVGRRHRYRWRWRRDRRRGSRHCPRPYRRAMLRSRLWRLRLPRSFDPCRRSEHPWPRPSAAGPSSTRCSVPPGSSASPQATPSSAAARRSRPRTVLDAVAIGATGPNQLKAYRRAAAWAPARAGSAV